MPDKKTDDPSAAISVLDRKLRHLRRRLQNVSQLCKSTSDDESFFKFEADCEAYKVDWERYQAVWYELDALYESSSESFPKDWESNFDSLYQDMRNAEAARLKLKAERDKGAATPKSSTQSAIGNHPSELPKIHVPKFNGDLCTWTHFRDTFTSLVHDNTNISAVSKMHYLRDALVGEPSSLLSGLSFDAKSYQQAWDALMREYDNPRVLASRQIQKILNFRCPANGSEYAKYTSYLSQVAESIEAFRALALESEGDVILSILALRALDPTTRRQFELHHAHSEFPSSDDVISFVRQRMMACKLSNELHAYPPPSESRSSANYKAKAKGATGSSFLADKVYSVSKPLYGSAKSSRTPTPSSTPPRATSPGYRKSAKRRAPYSGSGRNSPNKEPCLHCKGKHTLPRCFAFSELSIKERFEIAKNSNACLNCLGHDHSTAQCSSKFTCRFCGGKHHSLLHFRKRSKSLDAKEAESGFAGNINSNALSPTDVMNDSILGTACAILDGSKHSAPTRLILDSGSQFTFVTSHLAAKLGGTLHPFDGHVSGLGGSAINSIKGWIHCRLRSTVDDAMNLKVRALVVDQITTDAPKRAVSSLITSQIRKYTLADPSFCQPGPIDMLVGIDIYPKLVTGAPIETQTTGLYLMPTLLGNVVMGSFPNDIPSGGLSLLAQDDTSILEQLKAFWELEEPGPVDRRHPDDILCEEIFVKSHSRTPEGRYVVKLPLRPQSISPDNNRTVALRRLYSLERKFERDPLLKEKYTEFMREYLSLGHMSVAPSSSPYIVPHHGVWQVKPHERKLRVVFDASCSAGSRSLNDVLLPGPKLQSDLGAILIRFRLFPIALTGDLVKMYRQVLVHPEDRCLQHILWREDPAQPVTEYELNTVTYGINTSAYQAIRVVRQLREDERDSYPIAAESLLDSIYVDDIVTGANSVEEAHELKAQLIGLFARGGFQISKWASNSPELLPEPSKSLQPQLMPQDDASFVKILGLTWSPQSEDDYFSFSVQRPVAYATKRVILSHIARVFDPLGFLAPVIFHAKVLLQEVWRHGLPWDEPLPSSLKDHWASLVNEWSLLKEIKIPRYVHAAHARLQLVGFSDASSKGYAAAVYLRVITPQGIIHSFLIKSKTKVAPTKFKTIAQLELCGALLLTRMMSSITVPTHHPTLYYTDSSVVLSWLRCPVHNLKVFEANRVSAILKDTGVDQWRFVRSESNPADPASRGCLPSELLSNDMWFHGPSWLKEDPLPVFMLHPAQVPPAAFGDAFHHALLPEQGKYEDTWICNFSSLQRLVRVTARIIRLARRFHSPQERPVGPILASEYSHALYSCARIVQSAALPPAIYGPNLPKAYSQLSPFVDQLGIVRVGGRLLHANVDYDQKHPILLPYDHHFTKLVVDDVHARNFHAGPTLTLSLLRAQFWIPRALKLIKSRIHRCVHCRIQRSKPQNPFMGALPRDRFEQHRAFSQVGVDYAGPFAIKESNRRKASLGKAYLCIFVCFSSKAVHLELVSSLSTDAFLATLDRFIARRGLPHCIHSDNGTNFVGASRCIKELYQFLRKHVEAVTDHLSPKSVQWKFIPPKAPHFGGLWEAGVKSVKALLMNSVAKQPFTYEELSTVLARIEGLLNSRPLCPLRDDADSYEFLTPGHFLVGDSISALPTDHHKAPALSLSSRWRLVQQHTSHIWSRWQRDYLHHLQQRTKWTKRHPCLTVGDLVVMTEERNPAGTWPVARVTEVFPGRDGVVRVVSIRTPSSRVFKRPVSSLVPLLIEDESNSIHGCDA